MAPRPLISHVPRYALFEKDAEGKFAHGFLDIGVMLGIFAAMGVCIMLVALVMKCSQRGAKQARKANKSQNREQALCRLEGR
jgi:hypothetical protein